MRYILCGEIAYCESKKNAKYQHYAARFAAKEAAYKAVSVLLDNKYDITWKQIEIKNSEAGKPSILFNNVEFENRIKSIDVSISHCKEYATSNVAILYE